MAKKKSSVRSQLESRRRKMDARKAPEPNVTIFRLRIGLMYFEPKIWREVEMSDGDLDDLHALIQCAMGWENDHLYGFRIDKVEYSPSDDSGYSLEEIESTAELRLADIARRHTCENSSTPTTTATAGNTPSHCLKLSIARQMRRIHVVSAAPTPARPKTPVACGATVTNWPF
jgi:hypothetical protein